jgi:hypothetical protein
MAEEASDLRNELPCLPFGEEAAFGEGGERGEDLDDDELLGICSSKRQRLLRHRGAREHSPANDIVINGKMYSSRLRLPTHPATSTATSFHLALSSQSLVLR